MCLYIKKDSVPLIAQKDIICYKVVRPTQTRRHKFLFWKYDIFKCVSVVRSHEYTCNVLNKPIHIKPKPFNLEYSAINEGYHVCLTRDKASCYLVYTNETIVECIIPKGTKYYVNPENTLAVASNIIITSKCVKSA